MVNALEVVEFKPDIRTVGKMPSFSMEDIRGEPMLFGCDAEHSHRLGGPITRAFLDTIGAAYFLDHIPEGLNAVFDCRTTLTMPGMYPSIPGWHCDDFNRGEKYGQPRLADRDRRIRHTMAIVGEGDGISCTEFITKPCTVALDPADVWHSLDKAIETDFKDLARRRIGNGEVIYFSQDSIHRATESVTHGWRWFGRMSITYRPAWNEVRKQVQVYASRNGW